MGRDTLITGATGFVGRHVLDNFLHAGLPVRAIVRPTSRTKLKDAGKISLLESRSLFTEQQDWWSEALRGVDTIVHLAWYAEPGKYLTAIENLDCLQGTITLAKAAIDARVRRFIGVGTCFEYDLTSGTALSVQTPLRPLTPYAATKASTYMSLSQVLPRQGVEFAWCRLFYLYGDGEDERRFVPYLRKSLSEGRTAELTSGNQVRDFLDVREAARRIFEISRGNATGAINVCSGVPITIRELAEKIAAEYGRPDLLNFGARPDNLVDPPYVVGVP